MSKKHHQRTRAQILAKRAQPIIEIPVQEKMPLPNGQTVYVPQPTSSQLLRAQFAASKYLPHQSTKEQSRAKRLYLSHDLNQQFVDHMLECRMILSDEMCHLRSAPTLCQMSKREYAELVRERVAA